MSFLQGGEGFTVAISFLQDASVDMSLVQEGGEGLFMDMRRKEAGLY